MTFGVAPDILYGSQILGTLDVMSALRSEIVSSPVKLTQLTAHPLVIVATASSGWMPSPRFVQQSVIHKPAQLETCVLLAVLGLQPTLF